MISKFTAIRVEAEEATSLQSAQLAQHVWAAVSLLKIFEFEVRDRERASRLDFQVTLVDNFRGYVLILRQYDNLPSFC